MRGRVWRDRARLSAPWAPAPTSTGRAHPASPAHSVCPAAASPEPVAEAAVSPQGLGEAEIEEAVLGHHVSQELNGRLAQVPLPEEVFLGDSGAQVRAQAGCTCRLRTPSHGAAPRGASYLVQ